MRYFINILTSAAASPGYGVDPKVTISQINTPKLQMSDLTENILSYRLSGAIHLIGSLPSDFLS